MGGLNRTRRWQIVDRTLARLPPGLYTIDELCRELNKDLYPASINKITTGHLLKAKPGIRFIGHRKGNPAHMWEVLPQQQPEGVLA